MEKLKLVNEAIDYSTSLKRFVQTKLAGITLGLGLKRVDVGYLMNISSKTCSCPRDIS